MFRPYLLRGLILSVMAILFLAGCERPDPQDVAVELPTETPTVAPTPTTPPTAQPLQLYVVVVQPTSNAPQPVAGIASQIVVTATPEPTAVPLVPTLTPEPTALPENFYLGWAWSNSLSGEGDRAEVDQYGITLRDQPSTDGRAVGLVVGYADVVIAGASRCGYTPVLIHANNFLWVDTPPPPIAPPQPRPAEVPSFLITPTPIPNTVTGWVYTDGLTVIGQTAISGVLGVNLRSDPCRFGTNLGFLPAGANMIVTGPASGDYTPIRVNRDVVQLPYNPPLVDIFDPVLATAMSPTPTVSLTPSATLTPTVTLTATVTATATPGTNEP